MQNQRFSFSELYGQLSATIDTAIQDSALVQFVDQNGGVIVGGDGTDEILNGTSKNDGLFGAGGSDLLVGLAGDDFLVGDGGNDVLLAGRGSDVLVGSDGSDVLWGGRGIDLMFGDAGNDVLLAGRGNDIAFGNAGDDAMWTGRGDDIAFAGSGDDYVHAGRGDDFAGGEDGDDRLSGGRGRDTLDGGAGDDRMNGGAHDDVLAGSGGNDTLTGGRGDRDTFVGVEGNDTITDFDVDGGRERSYDRLEFAFDMDNDGHIEAHEHFALSTTEDFVAFVHAIETNGDGSDDALVNGRDLVLALERDHEGNITRSVTLENVVGRDGLTNDALRTGEAGGADVFNDTFA